MTTDNITELTNSDKLDLIDQRTAMMQAWADYLDELKAGAKVLPFKQA